MVLDWLQIRLKVKLELIGISNDSLANLLQVRFVLVEHFDSLQVMIQEAHSESNSCLSNINL
jgi:hypothetical protein